MEDSERLEVSKWILERNLAWIAASEIKVGVIVTINTAMLAVLGAAISSLPPVNRTAWACLFAIIAFICCGLAILFAARSIVPKVTGPEKSNIFFGSIAAMSGVAYVDQLTKLTADKFISDCGLQIHRNAEIACEKYKGVTTSIGWSFFAIIPWVLAISLLMRDWK